MQNIDSVLVNGRSVCAGYSKTYKFLLNRMGVPCIYVIGSTNSADFGQSYHAWNIAQIDGKLSYTDITWADGDIINWTKFDVPYLEFVKDHVEKTPEILDEILSRCRVMDTPFSEENIPEEMR